MPPAQLIAVIGDDNVRRNMTVMNRSSRPLMETAKVIDCHTSATLRQALKDVPQEVTGCIIQSVSSIIAAAADAGSVFSTIDPVLTEFSATISEFCSAKASLQVLVAPPMFRTSPCWYRRGLPEISHQFSLILSANRPRNLHLLSGPTTQDLSEDGYHLTPVSGLHYVLHLFDDAQRFLNLIGARGEV